MLILLPPSETKRPGGRGRPYEPERLALPGLTEVREQVVTALVGLSSDEEAALRILKLSERQRPQVALNAVLRSSPTMPAIDRYTGVLYDALDADALDAAARRWLGAHVMIHSAPFGPVRALDPVPAYRLAAGASLPGLPPLARVWSERVGSEIASLDTFVLDLRSEAYVALGVLPEGVPSAYVRVVTAGEDGTVRALNHFNKHAKGALVRALAQARPRVSSLPGFLRWANTAGFTVRSGAPGEVELVV